MHRRFFVLAALAACTGSFALADDKKPCPVTGSFNLETYSKYVWRGINSNNGGVLWPTLSLNYGGFSAYVFGSMELTNWNHYGPAPFGAIHSTMGSGGVNYLFNPAWNFSEYDLGLSYACTMAKIGWTLGVVNYVYPRTGIRQTSEAYVTAALPCKYSPTVSLYHDVEASQGWYGNLSLSHTLPSVFLTGHDKYLPLSLSAGVGAGDASNNAYYYGNREAAFTDLLLSASTQIPCGKNMTWTPSVKYATMLDDGQYVNAPRKSNLWLGISFNYSF